MARGQPTKNDPSEITEKMKTKFQKAYSLRGANLKAQKSAWLTEHANEDCDLCYQRGHDCTSTSSSRSRLSCDQCIKQHRICSKPAKARKHILIKTLQLTEEQFDALNKWYNSAQAAGPKTQAKSTRSQKKPVAAKGDTNGDEDSESDDDDGEEAEVEKTENEIVGRSIQKADTRSKINKTLSRTVSKRKPDAEPDASLETATGAKRTKRIESLSGMRKYSVAADTTIFLPDATLRTNRDTDAHEREGHASETPAETAPGIDNYFPVRARSGIESSVLTEATATPNQDDGEPQISQFPLLARHLKRELEENTTDLRFKRKSTEDGVDVYDQIAVKFGLLIEQYGLSN